MILLSSVAPPCEGRQSVSLLLQWPSMRIPVLSLPLCPCLQPQDPVAHLWCGESFSTPAPSSMLLWPLPAFTPASNRVGMQGWSSEQSGRASSPAVINSVKNPWLTRHSVCGWTKEWRRPYINSSILYAGTWLNYVLLPGFLALFSVK